MKSASYTAESDAPGSQGAAKVTVSWPAAVMTQLPAPGTTAFPRQAQVGAVRHAAGRAAQRWDGMLVGTPPIVVSQYSTYDWH
jgi:hypothetical protein